MILAGSLGIFLSNLCTYYEATTLGTYTQNYVQLFDYLTAIVVFLLAKSMVFKVAQKRYKYEITKVIYLVGSLTFGIYLFDPILKVILYPKYEALAEPLLPTLIVSFGWIMISMICGGCLTYIMKKIPGVKRLM